MEIEHEGKTYILKSQVEGIIKERVAKVAQRATEFETQVQELESLLSKQQSKQASYDVLAQQVNDLRNKLSETETKHSRYITMSKHGITDPELIEVIQWQYNRSMKGKNQKEQQPLEEWFSSHLQNPDEAPITLRPHLQKLQPEEEVIQDPETGETETSFDSKTGIDENSLEMIQEREIAPPMTNKGAVKAPEGKDILRRAVEDPSFYNENVEAIRKAWFARYGRR